MVAIAARPSSCPLLYLSVMNPLKVDEIGSAPEPLPLAVPSRQAPHINESPYCSPLRATAGSSGDATTYVQRTMGEGLSLSSATMLFRQWRRDHHMYVLVQHGAENI